MNLHLLYLFIAMRPTIAALLYSGFSFAAQGNQFAVARDGGSSCPIDSPLSCLNAASDVDACCFESPGGVLLSTQFWDYNPAVGADDEWTLHGLWPDNCDGSYEQFCDDSLTISGSVKSIIVDEFGDNELYDFMTKTWKNYNGDDESLWEHEYNKHGTCIRTIKPKCYSNPKRNQNVYDFYRIAVNLYKKLNTYKFLTDAGIEPSTTKTYTKDQIQKALNKGFGEKTVYFKCDKSNALQEVWYFHHIKGSVLGEQFVEINALSSSGCSNLGIKWVPKGEKAGPTPTSSNGGSKPTGTKGNIKVEGKSGCLISNGKYYEKGTCASFTFAKATFGGYNIKSSKGYCGVDGKGQFACGSSFQPSDYQFNHGENGEVGYGNNYKWCFGTEEGSPPQTNILLATNGKCDGKDTFALLG